MLIFGGYTLVLAGITLQVSQATELVNGIPDSITIGMVVFGLVGANILQWRQYNKDKEKMNTERETFRAEMKEVNKEVLMALNGNTKALEGLLNRLK